MKHKIGLSIFLILAVLFSVPVLANAMTYDLSNGPAIVNPGDGNCLVTGEYSGPGPAVLIKSNYSGYVTLSNVKITTTSGDAVIAERNSDLTLVLSGPNEIITKGYASSPLVASRSTIDGDGSLVAAADNYGGAAIGGEVWIKGGTIYAYGGDEGAGIGGSYDGDSAKIHISGGRVYAYGGVDAAGIGGGVYGTCSEILIDGGYIEAYSGGDMPAGIGHGICNFGASRGIVTIKGNAEVYVRGNGSSIGKADGVNVQKVSILENAKVTALNYIVCDTFELDSTANLTICTQYSRAGIRANVLQLASERYLVSGETVTSKTNLAPRALSTIQRTPVFLYDYINGDLLASLLVPPGYTCFTQAVSTPNPVRATATVGSVGKVLYNVTESSLIMTPRKVTDLYKVTPVDPEPTTYIVEYYVGSIGGDGYKLGSVSVSGKYIGDAVIISDGSGKGELNYMRPANEYSAGVQQDPVPQILNLPSTVIRILYKHEAN